MPQFLYQVRPTRLAMLTEGPTEQESAILGRHFAYLEQLLAQGVLLMAGRTLTEDARTFGIAILEAESEAAALRWMQDDPAVAEGVMWAELFPYRVALWADAGPPR